MSNYTMKTASLKSTIVQSNIVQVGDTTEINKRGINTNNIVADSIKTSDEDPYLTKSVADNLYGGSSQSYDWAPAQEQKIQFSLQEGESYTVPSNGWFVVNEKEINEGSIWTISINQRPMFHSDSNGQLHVQVLVKMGDVITSNSNTSRNGYFMPCVSELRDWRVEELKSDADIWKNAVVTDADGNINVRDQWLDNNNSSSWYNTYNSTYGSTLSYIENDEAFDANGNHLFYVQTENIKNGYWMFTHTALQSFNGDLSSLTNGNSMFWHSALESFSGDLSSLTDGHDMFRGCLISEWNIDLPNLINGDSMFYENAIASWNIDLPNLTDGDHMFFNCPLTSFKGDLPSLKYGYYMFYASALASFSGDLSSLTDPSPVMFNKSTLKSFSGDLSGLTAPSGYAGNYDLFNYSSLASFDGNLSNLIRGSWMFYDTPLTSFNSDLSSLTDGYYMFYGCKLNIESVQNIASTIKTVTSGTLHLGIQSSLQGNADLTNALNAITSKGWKVTTQYNK